MEVDGDRVAAIGAGLLVLVAAGAGTARRRRRGWPRKVARLRIFADADGRMNRSLADVGGEALVVSQFTLYADVRRGNRPGFTGAAPPEVGERLVDAFAAELRALGVPVATGRFGAHMHVRARERRAGDDLARLAVTRYRPALPFDAGRQIASRAMRAFPRTRERRVEEVPTSIETAERAGHGRLAADPARGDFRGNVIAFLVCAIGLVGCVGGFNAAVDPYGITGAGLVPTAIESDRAAKITLLEDLKHPPDILILGSSRSRPAAPRVLQHLTGETGFNAGVTSGDSVDEMVFSELMDHRFPGVPRRYLIFVNVGIGGAGVNPQLAADPRARPYLTAYQRTTSGEPLLTEISDYLSVQATRDSLRVVRACVFRTCSRRWFNADGSLLPSRLDTTAGSATQPCRHAPAEARRPAPPAPSPRARRVRRACAPSPG